MRKPGLIPLLFITLTTASLIGLGVWQLYRLQWKNALQAEIAAAQSAPRLAVLPEAGADDTSLNFYNVQLKGKYLYEKTMHFIGRKSGGYVLYTPMKLEDGRFIIVNRGWTPSDWVKEQDESDSNIQAFLRIPNKPRLFSPPNSPERNLWFTEVIPQMEQYTGLSFYPLIAVVTSPQNKNGRPEVHPIGIRIRNDHLGYAVTWFSLAIIGVVMFGIYYRESTKS